MGYTQGKDEKKNQKRDTSTRRRRDGAREQCPGVRGRVRVFGLHGGVPRHRCVRCVVYTVAGRVTNDDRRVCFG